jgi:hypothetical protein
MLLFTVLLCAPPGAGAKSREHEFLGQISAWHLEARDRGDRYYNQGVRYIPRLSMTQCLNADQFLDLEISLNAFAAVNSSEGSEDADLDLYRLKLRFATAQTETRIGLQRINFGPAHLLRSLRWFDSLDPRDPLGLTEGVWGLRFRYVTLSNTSLWLWGLLGNDDPKGYELLASDDERPELGGRLQLPLPRGEGAVTFHRRTVTAPVLPPGPVPPDPGDPPGPPAPGPDRFTENRFAIDGRWDVEIGLWLEAVLQQQRYDLLPRPWTKMITLGGDYTLGVGSGLHLLAEYMATALSEKTLGWDQDSHLWALSLNYPMGYLDNLSAIWYYSHEDEKLRQYLAWQRTWDDWFLNVSLFHYPDANDGVAPVPGGLQVTGAGGQVLVVINH